MAKLLFGQAQVLRGMLLRGFTAAMLAFQPLHAAHAQDTSSSNQKAVIFLPGILGSVLELKSRPGTYVWGDYFDGVAHFSKIAWPIDKDDDPRFNPKRVLYGYQILGPFQESAYKGISKFLKKEYGGSKLSYFEFPYDWRYSNLQTACTLKTWLDNSDAKFPGSRLKQRALGDGVVLVGHSMGGVVSNLFARFYAPAGTPVSNENPCPHQYKVSMIVTAGTPYSGAAIALRGFTDGPARYLHYIEWNEADLRKTYYSIPAIYELAPSYDSCCYKTDPGGTSAAVPDPLEFQTWDELGWIPKEMRDAAGGLDFVKKCLSRARLIRSILAKPVPDVRVIRVAGNGTQTLHTYTGTATGGHVYTPTDAGDGTVPQVSADPTTETVHAVVSRSAKTDHMGLMDSTDVHRFLSKAIKNADQTLAVLEEEVRGVRGTRTTSVATRGGGKADAVQMTVYPGADYLSTNYAHEATFTVYGEFFDETGVTVKRPIDNIDPDAISATLVDGGNRSIPAAVTMRPGGIYVVGFKTPNYTGVLKLTITLPGEGINRTNLFAVIRAKS